MISTKRKSQTCPYAKQLLLIQPYLLQLYHTKFEANLAFRDG